MYIIATVRVFNMQKAIAGLAGTFVFIIYKMCQRYKYASGRCNNRFHPAPCKSMAQYDGCKTHY